MFICFYKCDFDLNSLLILMGYFCLQGKHLIPPPWLIAMQRYGPPPSYPNLKIPGLNAAIPEVLYLNQPSFYLW